MGTGRIAKCAVDAIEPGASDRYLWDTDLAGFGLKVTPKGRKVYLVQYRIGGRRGRTRRLTLGIHGQLTPEQARARAKQALGRIAAGADPADERAQAKGDLLVSELCDLYLAEGCATKKPTTIATDRSNIERHIKPLLGRRRLSTVTRADIERLQLDIAAGRTAADVRTKPRGRAIVSGGKGTAARTVAVLGAVFTFAVKRGMRPDNPVRGVRLYRNNSKERFLSPAELARLGDALATAEREGVNSSAIAGIRLLLLTGARKSEIAELRWEHVDTDRACIRLPDSKTGAKSIPLGAAALAVFAGLARTQDNPYVLPGVNDGFFTGLPKAWRRIRERASLADVRLHDFRHSFASVAVAGGDSLYLVGKVLGHKQSRTTEIYAHLADDPVRAVADKVSRHIAAAMNAGKGGLGEIVRLRRNDKP